jgi:ribose transport system ATP-binding protein
MSSDLGFPKALQAASFKKTQRWLSSFSVDISPDVQVGRLSVAKQQLVAIARALSLDAEVISSMNLLLLFL